MKKGWKIFWIVCGILAGVGVVFCVIALALGVTTDRIRIRIGDGIGIVRDESDVTYAEDIRETYNGVEKIDAYVYAGTVKILPADVPAVTVETDGISEELGFESGMDGTELKITTREHLWRINNVGIGTIYIYIPNDLTLDDISMKLGAGNLYIEEIHANEMSVDAGTGEAVLQNVQAQKMGLQCGVGNIAGSGCAAEELDADVGVGSLKFTLTGPEENYDYDISVGVGEVRCGQEDFSGLGARKEIDNHAGRLIKIDCGAGSAVIDFDGTGHMERKEEHHNGY